MHRSPRLVRSRRFAVAVVATGALVATLAPGAAGGQEATEEPTADLAPEVQAQIAVLEQEKADRSPAEAKVSSQLLRASAAERPALRNAEAPRLRSSVEVVDGRTTVDIDATVTQGLLDAIEAAGGDVVASVAAFDAVRAELPIDAVVDLAGRDDVTGIRPADQAITNGEGNGANEAEVTHGADDAKAFYEVDGTGTKVCAISDGVTTLNQRVATGDLPADVDVLPGQAGTGDEGTAMLELIHDIAPGAELGFATGFTGVAQFAANIVALEQAGCTVIVDDLTYFNESNFQDGPIAQAVSQVRASGVPYFTSAGNSGNLLDGTSGTWQGDFDNEGAATGPLAGSGTVHGWGLSGTPYNTITLGSQRVDLMWADPLGGATNDYDLYILNSAGTEVVDASNDLQDGDDDPYEAVGQVFTNERVVVVRWSGANRYLAVYTNRGRLQTATGGASRGHNASLHAISVAATPADGPFPGQHSGTDVSETFTSDGPHRQFFGPTGSPITPGNFSSSGGVFRNGVDLTAADGVTTTTPGFETFFGTSAAAPNAAALAALALEANPTLTPGDVERAMADTAIDIEVPGVDPVTGAGIVMASPLLDAAIDEAPLEAVYVPITPCRILDTRIVGGALDNREIRDVQVRGAGGAFAAQGGKAEGCGIPSGAVAVESSVTAVDPADSGFFRAWPGDESMPNATFMNFDRAKDITNTGAITLGTFNSGELKIRNFGGRSQYVIDLQGYYIVPGGGSAYVSITPCRLVDTRIVGGSFDNREIRDYDVRGTGGSFAAQGGKANGCGVPDEATGIEASVTSVSPADSGFFRAWPGDESMPNATFMNFARAQDITNTGAIPLATSGPDDLTVRNFGGRSQYVIDVQGYFIDLDDLPNDGSGSLYVPITPCRIVDTRQAGGSFANREIRDYQVRGVGSVFDLQGGKDGGCRVPPTAAAAEASVTSVSPADSGFFRAWPGDESMPNATFMNFARAQDITNTGSVTLADSGDDDLTVRNFGGRSQYVIDLQGYWRPVGILT